jgi:branched-subunit amino acid aminotransferase/4-amino-4-deoxychorismate lyase
MHSVGYVLDLKRLEHQARYLRVPLVNSVHVVTYMQRQVGQNESLVTRGSRSVSYRPTFLCSVLLTV